MRSIVPNPPLHHVLDPQKCQSREKTRHLMFHQPSPLNPHRAPSIACQTKFFPKFWMKFMRLTLQSLNEPLFDIESGICLKRSLSRANCIVGFIPSMSLILSSLAFSHLLLSTKSSIRSVVRFSGR